MSRVAGTQSARGSSAGPTVPQAVRAGGPPVSRRHRRDSREVCTSEASAGSSEWFGRRFASSVITGELRSPERLRSDGGRARERSERANRPGWVWPAVLVCVGIVAVSIAATTAELPPTVTAAAFLSKARTRSPAATRCGPRRSRRSLPRSPRRFARRAHRESNAPPNGRPPTPPLSVPADADRAIDAPVPADGR